MIRTGSTGASGQHRINRPRCTGALCSAWEEKFQCIRINRRHRVGLSDRLSRIIRRVSRQRRSKHRVIDQRACWQDQDTLLRTGSSDTTSDKHTGAMTSAWQAQKKERPKDRMIRRQLGVKRRSIRPVLSQQFENPNGYIGL